MRANKIAAAAIITLIISAAAFCFILMPAQKHYIGSKKCGECHEPAYISWKKTLHAKAIINAGELKKFPETIQALTKLDAIGETCEISYAIGSHWTRRYLLSNKSIAPVLYSITEKKFTDYFDKNYKRTDYTTECIGCHVTGLSVLNKTAGQKPDASYFEAGVGCEACHGPGSAHVELSDINQIVNPKKLTAEKKEMICMSCHTNGYDRSGVFKFPVNYKPGSDLTLYFTSLSPKPGQLKHNYENRFEYAADNSFEDRKRQFEYWKYMFLAKDGLSCADCLDIRGSEKKGRLMRENNKSDAEKPDFFSCNQYCMSCHASTKPFDEYISNAQAKIKTSCKFINEKWNLSETAREKSCLKCHETASVHDHFYFVEYGR